MQLPPSPTLFYFLFFASGFGAMLLGVLVPELHLQQTDAQTGRLIATQFTGQLLGALLVTKRPTGALLLGLLLCAGSVAVLAVFHTLYWPTLFLYGLGMGITMTATNIVTGMEALPEQRVARMEMLNAFWPMGALCAPLLVRQFRTQGVRLYLLVATLPLAGTVWLLFRKTSVTTPAQDAKEDTVAFAIGPLVWLSLLGLFSVGVETAVSTWAALFGQRYFPATKAITFAPSIFWAGTLFGRSIASRLSKYVAWLPLTLWSSLISAAAIAATSASPTLGVLVTATFVCAMCVAPLYPAVLARCVLLPGKNLVFFSAGIAAPACRGFLAWFQRQSHHYAPRFCFLRCWHWSFRLCFLRRRIPQLQN